MKVGIVGASGYTGVELVRLLKGHPEVKIELITSESFIGDRLCDIYPHVGREFDMVLEEYNQDDAVARCDVLFLALPHGYSSEAAAKAYEQGKLVIDLGADFRLRELATYSAWYSTEHKAPHLLKEAVYGLPEIYSEQLKGAKIIANPGCYPTSAILALAPLLRKGIIEPKGIIIDAKSGVSGAGRKATTVTHFNSCSDNINPYGVARHRHSPEMEQELSCAAGQEVTVTFTPQLVPINRGILSTCYGTLTRDIGEAEIRSIYEEFYADKPFVHMLPEGTWPHTKWVAGSNNCLLNFTLDVRNKRIIAASVIDNLVKGASGQAVQNMNIALGIPEITALKNIALYP
ncbi:MAG: N-acetyl-gamma-glutamyl-phosphate reductase [Bacillota bacterium]